MSFSFKYKPVKLNTGEIVRRPIVPITLQGTKTKLDVLGFLDTGSDISIIPREIAEVLGIEFIEEGEVIGITGNKMKVSRGKLNIIFGKERQEYQFDIPVLIPEKEGGQVIIGRFGFFEQFRITFSEVEKRITFKKLYPREEFKKNF